MKPILATGQTILAIDPGCERSAFVLWDGAKILESGILENYLLILDLPLYEADFLCVEMVSSYGMPVGKEVFETVLWTGRFIERWQSKSLDWMLIYRQAVKLHHCHSARAKDSNVRQALIDKYGAPGTKKNPGLTYGLKADLWAAFAIATFASETKLQPPA